MSAPPTPEPVLSGAPAPAASEAIQPPGQAEQAASFAECGDEYKLRIDSIVIGGPVTPALLESWDQAFQDAAARSAEGDDAGAAAACQGLLDEMARVLG